MRSVPPLIAGGGVGAATVVPYCGGNGEKDPPGVGAPPVKPPPTPVLDVWHNGLGVTVPMSPPVPEGSGVCWSEQPTAMTAAKRPAQKEADKRPRGEVVMVEFLLWGSSVRKCQQRYVNGSQNR